MDRSREGSRHQIQEMRRIVETYPSRYIDAILIGNEALFREELSEEDLISHIAATKAYLKSKNLAIPVGTSEIGVKWSTRLAAHVDILAVNIHPFFGGVPVDVSTKW